VVWFGFRAGKKTPGFFKDVRSSSFLSQGSSALPALPFRTKALPLKKGFP